MGLNKSQREAANHFTSPCMVIAGPGSGKTTVLLNRVQNLVEQYRVKPEKILVLTYTKAAAEQMRQRYFNSRCKQTKHRMDNGVTFGTFHAVCYQILKSQFPLQKKSLISEREKYIYLNPIIKKWNIQSDVAEEVLRLISLQKNGLFEENTILPNGLTEDNFAEIAESYIKKMKENSKIDFDDMVKNCLELFRCNKEMLRKWQERFPFILVDEFQDCNSLQYEVLKLLAGERKNLFVVGDDDQSIYGFRGAKPDIMKQFTMDYPEAKIILLEANYRSRKEIVIAAKRLIARNPNRFLKNIYSASEDVNYKEKPVRVLPFLEKTNQYNYLAQRIKEQAKECIYSEIAVIFRTNREIQDFLPYLEMNKIPYIIKGMVKNRYDHFAVKDLAAYMQLISGKRERHFLLQVMNKPNRGLERIWIEDDVFSWDDIKKEAIKSGEYGAADALDLLKRQCVQAGKMSPYLAINWVRKVMGYNKWLSHRAGREREVLEEWTSLLDQIQKEAQKFSSVEEWISFIKTQTESNADAETEKEEGVQLMTMHTAKGLEFTFVYIPNVNRGNIPHVKTEEDSVTEEERRLFYVAMTRAKTALEVLYLTGTKEHPRLPSSFLNELWEYKEDSLEDYSSVTSSSNS